MEIRKATPDDFGTILEFYKAGLEENGITNYKESCLVNKIAVSYYLAPCFLLEDDGIILGMAGLTSVTLSHNSEASLADYMFYVLPEHRNINTLGDLVRAAKGFAIECDLPLRIDFTVNGDEKLRQRVMRMFGFKIGSVSGVFNG